LYDGITNTYGYLTIEWWSFKVNEERVTLAVASRNKCKVNEIKRIFVECVPDIEWIFLSAQDLSFPEIEETGETFMENAAIKAVFGARHSGRICIGEDSGIEVDVLGGAPGVKSHRFAETGADEDNNRLLLELLKDVPWCERTCRYKCAIAVADSQGIVAQAEGCAEGIVDLEPKGSSGFGYDPIFYSVELGKTFGEASDSEKDRVSHRRRAVESLMELAREHITG